MTEGPGDHRDVLRGPRRGGTVVIVLADDGPCEAVDAQRPRRLEERRIAVTQRRVPHLPALAVLRVDLLRQTWPQETDHRRHLVPPQ